MNKYISITVFVIATLGCSERNSSYAANCNESAAKDTLFKWESYFQSSAIGLWEDSAEYDLSITRVHAFGGEDDLTPIFYKPGFVHVMGDTLLITDEATQSLVCMDTTGTLLWKFGESGEGPGYFAGIGQIDVIGDTIAVINNGLSAVELLTRSGQLLDRISIERPQDISFIDSNRLLIYSKAAPGGDLHLFDLSADSVIYSFADGEWEEWPNSGSYYEIWGVYLHPDTIAYISQFEKKMLFADLSNRTSYWTEIRDLPMDITPTQTVFDEEANMYFTTNYPIYRSMFIGPHGQINILFAHLMYNGEMFQPGNTENTAPVSMVDRFSSTGEYLDSYCLPDSSLNVVFYNGDGYLAAIESHTGIVYGYRVDIAQSLQ